MKSKPKTPPRNRSAENPADPEMVRGKAPRETGDASAAAGNEKDEDPGPASKEDVISRWKNPVTNQDEQEKITNAGADDTPVVKE